MAAPHSSLEDRSKLQVETFLSDVHLDTPFLRAEKRNSVFTRFRVIRSSRSAKCCPHEVDSESEMVADALDSRNADEDGDLCPPRKISKNYTYDMITIEHGLSAPLEDVGLQIWRGALLLCDFLIHNEDRFDGCTALELGAGVGLCSIVMARVARRVFCTDAAAKVLSGCDRNINLNSHLFQYGHDVVKVCKLDWLTPCLSTAGPYGWSSEDQDNLDNVSVFMAADVIYDDSLTDAFFTTVLLYLQRPGTEKVLFLAIEKRLNFSLEHLDVVSPAYSYFISWIKKLQTHIDYHNMAVKKLATDFPRCLQYNRVKELELWEIKQS